jgi:hypothetical protein
VSEHSPNSSLGCFCSKKKRFPSSIPLKPYISSGSQVYKFNKVLDFLGFNIYFVLEWFYKFIVQVVFLFRPSDFISGSILQKLELEIKK